MLTNLFINGCSFLTPRPKDGVDTHSGIELSNLMNLKLKSNLAMGGRGNERISFTTKLWFEQNGYIDTFAVIGWSSMMRNDYVTNDGWKKGRIPNMDLTWRSWKLTDNLDFTKKHDQMFSLSRLLGREGNFFGTPIVGLVNDLAFLMQSLSKHFCV